MRYTPDYWADALNACFGRFLILYLLCREPSHGYALRRRVAAFTGNGCTPSEGSLYPALRDLERSGCLRRRPIIHGGRQRFLYEATARGRKACEDGRKVWRDAIPWLSSMASPDHQPDPASTPPASRGKH